MNPIRTSTPISNYRNSMCSNSRIPGPAHINRLRPGSVKDQHNMALFSSSTDCKEIEEELDTLLLNNNLKEATRLLQTHTVAIALTKERILDIFRVIEVRTTEAEENDNNKRTIADQQTSAASTTADFDFTPLSPARTEMTDMYRTLQSTRNLNIFGAASTPQTLPIRGSKNIPGNVLEEITKLPLSALSPKPTNTLLYTGIALAIGEGLISQATGINANFLFFLTIFIAFLDNLVLSGACLESIYRILIPSYSTKVLRHEAGHFLTAYLLGCPVEGCVLTPWAALADARFGSRVSSATSAGTSFFDPELSSDFNSRGIVRRESIDRFSIIVMGGIAAEAMEFGSADGGAGDEAALVGFLRSLNPKMGGSKVWDENRIRTQARWGVMQAVMLLREYKGCYDALVEALENGGSLGECVYAIESALEEMGEEKNFGRCVGSIQEGYGGAVRYVQGVESTVVERAEADITDTNGVAGRSREFTPIAFNDANKPSSPTSTIEEDAASLQGMKERMEQKLKNLDEKLNNL